MRIVALVLAFLIVVIQYPLWLGKGGWLRVWELDRQVKLQQQANDKLRQRNAGLDAEVRDLKQGFEAIEERARYELGMIRGDEVFFQVVPPAGAPAAAGNANAAGSSKAGAPATVARPDATVDSKAGIKDGRPATP